MDLAAAVFCLACGGAVCQIFVTVEHFGLHLTDSARGVLSHGFLGRFEGAVQGVPDCSDSVVHLGERCRKGRL